jgi:predicted translin family RNA/ssDNA-binding protein
MNNLLKKSIKKYQGTQDLIYGVQKLSNKIRAKSKEAIALLRREDKKESEKIIKEVENLFKLINKIAKENKELKNQGFYKEAVEEYIEAITFLNFLRKPAKKMPDFIEVNPEEVISGICDFTGELVRRAITIASPENLKELVLYEKTVENIAQELTKIGFRGKLRQKYDEVERNLRKIEEILYDIKLKNELI